MSYTPTEWKTGDVITADKLNNMENGILNAPGVAVFEFEVITDNDNQVVTDVTYQDVLDAYSAGKLCVANFVQHTSTDTSDRSNHILALFDAINPQNEYVSATYTSIAKFNQSVGSALILAITGGTVGWFFTQSSFTFGLS